MTTPIDVTKLSQVRGDIDSLAYRCDRLPVDQVELELERISKALADLPAILRVYRAWEGAAVAYVEEDRGYTRYSRLRISAPDALEGKAVRLVPEGEGS